MDYEVERIVTDEELNKLKEQGFVIEIIEEYDLTYKVKIKNPVMGVPITFLNNYNPDQFEIVSFRKGEDGKDLVFTRERESSTILSYLCTTSIARLIKNAEGKINGKPTYARITIRRKKNQ